MPCTHQREPRPPPPAPAPRPAGLEIADAADDGTIGETRTDAWETYLAIDWRATKAELYNELGLELTFDSVETPGGGRGTSGVR